MADAAEMHQTFHEQGVMQTNFPNCQPQSNGLVESCVGLMKSSCRRQLFSANMPNAMWPYAVQFSAQMQSVLGYDWN
eukprot:4332770-Amphidinium_carterae.1